MNGTVVGPDALLVVGAWVLTMGSAGAVRDGAVLVDEGLVVAVGPADQVRDRAPDATVVGTGDGIVLPGLVNTHTHLSEAFVTGLGSELTLFEWGTRILGPVGPLLDAELAEQGAVMKGVELLHSGVTTVNDMFVHAHPTEHATLGVVAGLGRVGLRGVVSFGAEDAVEDVEAFAARGVDGILAEHHELAAACVDSRLVDFRYGIGTLLGQSDELLAAGVAACEREGWAVHTHLHEVREEVVAASLRWGRRPIAHADATGLLARPLVAAHAVWVTDDEVDLLADAGTAVAHNPVANMILGSGVCPLGRLHRAGLVVGIGTDGAASNDGQDMLQAVKTAALLQKVHALDPSVIDADRVLAMATIDGARALGIDHLVGSLEPGKRADVVVLDGTVETVNQHDPAAQVVYASSPRSVAEVLVDGRRVVVDGRVTTVDEGELLDGWRVASRDLGERSGLVPAADGRAGAGPRVPGPGVPSMTTGGRSPVRRRSSRRSEA